MLRSAIGDIHLSGYQSDQINEDGLPKRLSYIIKSLNYIVEFSKSKNIFDFDILGDIINDKSIIYTTAQDAFKNFLIKNKDCRFKIISGNHDLSSTGELQKSAISVFSEYPNVTCITEGVQVIDGIVYIPYTNNFLEQIKNISGANIMLSHLGLNEAHLQSGLSHIDKISIRDLSKFKLVLLGHYHKPQELNNGTTKVLYCGSVIPKDWNDKGETKRFLIYDTESLEVTSFPIQCGIPEFREFVITSSEQKTEILKQAEISRNQGHHVRIKNNTSEKIQDEVSGGVLVIEKNEIDITNRGIEITQTREEQLKKYLDIKQIPQPQHSEYLSIISKYDLLKKEL